ncbi:glycosyltransferase family 71 protein [Stipitochalara longipes BDJ]|nr:glycosyltransferase family 71 protein [Stipitochalara longipes BDJ]
MRSRTRIIASAAILLVIISGYLSWRAFEQRGGLLDGADDISHPDEIHNTQPAELPDLLHEFVQRPILSYDEAVESNKKTCPTEGVNFDEGAVIENDKTWRLISSAKISDWRKNIAEYLSQKEKEKQEKMSSTSTLAVDGQDRQSAGERGIVMAAGDHASVVRARTNIRLLRSYNCSLPIEIFNFANEISAPDKSLLEGLPLEQRSEDQEGHRGMTVTIRIAEGVQKGKDWKAFHIKAAAIQQSSFDEILYLDTDSYPVRNPEYLFESKQWKDTGLILWPDYTKSHATNPIWRLVGQQCRNEYEGESGQIFISRSLHQDLLWVAEYFALKYHEFYGFLGGDRDSFRTAALLLDKKWTGPGRLNAAAGVVLNNPQGGGHTMLQSDPEGKWLFVHANLIKHARFQRPLWSRIHRAAQDKFAAESTYGNSQPPNDALGNGVKLRVVYQPMMSTVMSTFEGYNEASVVVEDWNSYEELKGFEEKWFGFGGVH